MSCHQVSCSAQDQVNFYTQYYWIRSTAVEVVGTAATMAVAFARIVGQISIAVGIVGQVVSISIAIAITMVAEVWLMPRKVLRIAVHGCEMGQLLVPESMDLAYPPSYLSLISWTSYSSSPPLQNIFPFLPHYHSDDGGEYESDYHPPLPSFYQPPISSGTSKTQ